MNCPCGNGLIEVEDVIVNGITDPLAVTATCTLPPAIDIIVECPVPGCNRRFNQFVRLDELVELK